MSSIRGSPCNLGVAPLPPLGAAPFAFQPSSQARSMTRRLFSLPFGYPLRYRTSPCWNLNGPKKPSSTPVQKFDDVFLCGDSEFAGLRGGPERDALRSPCSQTTSGASSTVLAGTTSRYGDAFWRPRLHHSAFLGWRPSGSGNLSHPNMDRFWPALSGRSETSVPLPT